jgi:hypothetical protein
MALLLTTVSRERSLLVLFTITIIIRCFVSFRFYLDIDVGAVKAGVGSGGSPPRRGVRRRIQPKEWRALFGDSLCRWLSSLVGQVPVRR